MSHRLAWLLAGTASLAVLVGVAALWRWEHTAVGISVGIPVAATLIAPLITWAFSAQPSARVPTSDQLDLAKQAVADRVLERWRQAAETDAALSGGAGRLGVPWTWSAADGSSGETFLDDGPGGTAAAVPAIAARIRQGRSGHVIVVAPAGSGKSTLAQLLVVELLRQAKPGDQVPVLLPVSAWNPDREGLCEWLTRWLADEVPGLSHSSGYGPQAAGSLVNRQMVLPVLDGLDVLPEEALRSVLSSGDLLIQNRFVLTCRDEAFSRVQASLPIADAVILTPGRVRQAEMMRFLPQVTEESVQWDTLFDQLARYPDLGRALSDPRVIYLASAVYKSAGSRPDELMAHASEPSERIRLGLLGKLVGVRLPRGNCVPRTHWEGGRAQRWLRFLANPKPDPKYRGADGIAWWKLYRMLPWLARWQALIRASLAGLVTWLLVILILKGQYGQLTGLAYSLAIFSSCLLLSHGQTDRPPSARPAWWWWIPETWVRSRRVLGAGFTALCCFGLFIGIRVWSTSHHPLTGIRAGAANGLVAGMIVILAAFIARIPNPPRSELATGTLTRVRQRTPPFAVALGLGVSFGLLSGAIAHYKHQGQTVPDWRQSVVYGLIIGLDFGAGTWLVRWAQARFADRQAWDLYSDFRSEQLVALLVPLILGVTFSSAFGLSAELTWSLRTGIMNGAIGIIIGGITTDLALYVIAAAAMSLARDLPFRVMKFLEACREQGILRPAMQVYVFAEHPDRLGLAAEPREEAPAGMPDEASVPAGR
ncbi:MAG: NACHT domain-containing protein [Streptosporangiaceae bacterium]